MIRVLVNGADGRMGREVVKAVNGDDALVLAGGIDVGDDLATSIAKLNADVVVDFTVPACVADNTRIIIESGAHPVVGTTGLDPAELTALQALAAEKKLGGLVAPNFAIGAVLLMHYAVHAARYMPHVEIIEYHHDKKLDAPSGTAHLTAQRIAQKQSLPEATCGDGAVFRGGRVNGIPVHSVRLPGLVAHQAVIFGDTGQTLTLRHDSISRESFMPGVVMAAKRVPALDHLAVGLETIMDLGSA